MKRLFLFSLLFLGLNLSASTCSNLYQQWQNCLASNRGVSTVHVNCAPLFNKYQQACVINN